MPSKPNITARDQRPPRKGKKLDPNNPMSPKSSGLRRTKAAYDQPSDVNVLVQTFGDLPGNVRPSVTADMAQQERFAIIKGWFLTEMHRQGPNRHRMARCEAYYDNEQWRYDKAKELEARGQDATVYNEVKPTIDWLIGTERRARVDFIVMAEDDGDAADDDAALKTKVLKYLDDTNMAQFERSWAAEDAFKAGIGWLEVGASIDPDEAPVFVGAESWRHVLWDSLCSRRDLKDARYLFRVKVVDFDVALALFPDKHEELCRCIQTGDDLTVFSEFMGGDAKLLTGLDDHGYSDVNRFDALTSRPVDMFNARKRIMLIECWWRRPVPRTSEDVQQGKGLRYEVCVTILTEHDILLEARSPYKHNRFPFVPVWAYRNKRTGLPYSPIWPLLGPQDALNQRMSKALFEANSNQIMVEKGAVDAEVMDVGELRDEFNDPNGVAVLKDGAISGNKVKLVERNNQVQHQLAMAQNDRLSIRSMSGVTGDNRGENSNVTSGKAVLAKQDQGSLLTAELFDNLLLARKQEGDLTLSVAEQYMTQPRTIRVAEGIGRGERVKVNQPTGVVDMGTGQEVFRNDLAARKAHFVIGEAAWKQAYAEASFETLLDVLGQLATAAPVAVINLLDLVFDMHPNLPKKRQIVQRIRSINGQTDPDAKLSPEEEAAKQQKQAIADEQMRLQLEQLQAQVAEAKAKGTKLGADAVLQSLTGIYQAAQAAQVIATLPQIAPITDELLRSSGFVDQSTGPVLPPGLGGMGAAPPMPGARPAGPPGTPPGGAPIPPLQQTDGALAGVQEGIKSPAIDGIRP